MLLRSSASKRYSELRKRDRFSVPRLNWMVLMGSRQTQDCRKSLAQKEILFQISKCGQMVSYKKNIYFFFVFWVNGLFKQVVNVELYEHWGRLATDKINNKKPTSPSPHATCPVHTWPYLTPSAPMGRVQ